MEYYSVLKKDCTIYIYCILDKSPTILSEKNQSPNGTYCMHDFKAFNVASTPS